MLSFNNTLRPTPTQPNNNAEGMRAVPQYEPRTIFANPSSAWERYATEIGSPAATLTLACVEIGEPLYYSPGTAAQIGGDGALLGDTSYRMVIEGMPPALVRGKMQEFLEGGLAGPGRGYKPPNYRALAGLGNLGQDDDDDGLPEDFFGGLSESPTLPTDSSGLPIGFFSGATASPIIPTTTTGGTSLTNLGTPAAPVLPGSDFAFSPTAPQVGAPAVGAPSNSNVAAAAISAVGSVANTAIKAATAPSATALTAAQIAAANAANPLNQVIPGLNMTMGSLLLIGGVLIGGAILISKIK